MVYLIGFGILVLIAIGIAMAASGRRYSEMTEEEFEAEAKRSSAMGAAVGGLQKIINPTHSTEHIVEQEQRIEAERTNSGDHPESGLGEQAKTPHDG
ncbi:MAG TPA: hypothetical protein VFW94_21760 [Candidatus Acidoferrales bacterium]|nr:hypothetical protein [Candidatus Acidoferrales bacterium]